MNDDIKQYVLEKGVHIDETEDIHQADGGSGVLYIRRAVQKERFPSQAEIRNSKEHTSSTGRWRII